MFFRLVSRMTGLESESAITDRSANYIIKRSNAQDLMLAYNIPYFTAGDVEAFLLAVARANGRIRKVSRSEEKGGAAY